RNSAEEQRQHGRAATAEDERDDRRPGDDADALVALRVEVAVIVVDVPLDVAHTGSETVGPKAAGRVARERSRSSDAETVNSPVTSRSETVSVTPMRSTGYPRPSHRPWNFTSS